MANLSKEARLDRLQKESEEILKRADLPYTTIETFQSYELTNTIAFEMAIRNPKLILRLNRILDFYKNHREKIDFIPNDYDDFNTSFAYRLHRRAQKVFYYWFEYITYVYWIEPYDLFYAKMTEETVHMLKSYSEFVANNENHTHTNREFLTVETDDISFETSIDYKNKSFFSSNPKPTNDDILDAIKNFDLNPCEFQRHNSVTINFSRPKLNIPAVFNKSFTIELNLELPEAEILSYIQYIKSSYDKHKTNMKTIAELLGVNKEDEWFFDADTHGLQKRDRRKSPSERLADLFFIYDCYSSNLSMDYAIAHLDRYWNEERNAFPEGFQIKTYKRYLKLAKDFIENRKYQSLLIGQ